MNGPSCGDCFYFDPLVGEQNAGLCRRMPPSVVAPGWPKTYVAEWCGEYSDGRARGLTRGLGL